MEDEQGGTGAGFAKPSDVMSATNRGDIYVSAVSQSAASFMQASDSRDRRHVGAPCARCPEFLICHSHSLRLTLITRTSMSNLPSRVRAKVHSYNNNTYARDTFSRQMRPLTPARYAFRSSRRPSRNRTDGPGSRDQLHGCKPEGQGWEQEFA